MALTLDDNQQRIVATKKKPAADRPKYYSAATRKFTIISEDFEAFLILQGRQRNSDAVKWLEQCTQFAKRDTDRDALAATALQADMDDANASEGEISPLIRLFKRFRETYNMTGFENVAEAGALLNDVQKVMSEFNHTAAALKHRKNYGKIATDFLRNSGVGTEETKQINSWFAPLAAY